MKYDLWHPIMTACTCSDWSLSKCAVSLFFFFLFTWSEGRLPRNVSLHPLLSELPIISCWLNSLCSNTLGCKPRHTPHTHTFHCMCHQLQGKENSDLCLLFNVPVIPRLECHKWFCYSLSFFLWTFLLNYQCLKARNCFSHWLLSLCAVDKIVRTASSK